MTMGRPRDGFAPGALRENTITRADSRPCLRYNTVTGAEQNRRLFGDDAIAYPRAARMEKQITVSSGLRWQVSRAPGGEGLFEDGGLNMPGLLATCPPYSPATTEPPRRTFRTVGINLRRCGKFAGSFFFFRERQVEPERKPAFARRGGEYS